MINDIDWKRVSDPADPNRCQATTSHGQCLNVAAEGSNYCMAHAGNFARFRKQENDMKNYKLDKWRQRVAEMANSGGLKSLSDEIGILRFTLETVLNQSEDSNALIRNSGTILNLVDKIERLVTSCQKLDKELEGLIDQEQLLIICDSIVQILGKNIEDKVLLDRVATEVIDAVKSATTEPNGSEA